MVQKGVKFIKIENFANKLFRLNLASYKTEVSFYFDLIYAIHGDKMVIRMMKKHFRSLANKQKINKKEKKLPEADTVSTEIQRLYYSNKKVHAILFITMYLTGRRSIDLSRLEGKNVSYIGDNKYAAFIAKDKKHTFRRNFIIDLGLYDVNWCGLPVEVFEKELKLLLKNKLVFGKVVLASLAREAANFQPHILRSIRALLLIRMGWSVNKVLEFVGWDDERSLNRYIKLDKSQVKALTWSEVRLIFNG